MRLELSEDVADIENTTSSDAQIKGFIGIPDDTRPRRYLDIIGHQGTRIPANLLQVIVSNLGTKLDNDADDIMRLIAKTLEEVKPSRPWKQRIVLGCWAVSCLFKN